MTKNILALFLDKLLAFPLWVKQIIYLRLRQNLAAYLSEDFISDREENIFHLYRPALTFAGKKELSERKDGLDENIYNFFANIDEGLSILEISMNNFWTMEEVSKYFILCLDQSYVKKPEAEAIYAMAGFIAGKFRTGEYFKRVGKVDVDQLEHVIIKQKEHNQKGENVKFAETMISMGLITEKDASSLLIIKEESKKRFILDSGIIPSNVNNNPEATKNYHDELAKLTEQNQLLKDRLTRILAFVKKNG